MKKILILGLIIGFITFSFAFKPSNYSAKEKLGKQLFFDPILSEDKSISCASCHKPQFAFADTVAFSIGTHGHKGLRNAPSVMNMSDRSSYFWDGRAPTLAAQSLFPISDKNEMNMPVNQAIARLNESELYRNLFLKTYHQLPNKENLGASLEAYERTLETSNTPHDRWLNDKKNHGMTAQQIRGRTIFREKGKCFECHFSPDFTGDEFKSIGLFDGEKWIDSGRAKITHLTEDIGKFKVPGLRNVAITAPYMHDGSFKTLRQIIDYYNNPMEKNPKGINRDTLLNKPLDLTEGEKQDLESFLYSLTDDQFIKKNRK